MSTMEMVNAFRIATGTSKIPEEWYELLEPDDRERARWRQQEFRYGGQE